MFVNGQQVANSTRPVLLFETFLPTRYYLPAKDVRMDLLTASETVTRCPYKVVCFYDERVDVVIDGRPQERPVTPFF